MELFLLIFSMGPSIKSSRSLPTYEFFKGVVSSQIKTELCSFDMLAEPDLVDGGDMEKVAWINSLHCIGNF